MLKPVRVSSAAAIAKWNQSIPKYHRYNGTAVRVRIKVPIRNELVVQLIRSVGIRKIKGKGNLVRPGRVQLASQSFIEAGDREPRLLWSRYERRRNAHRSTFAFSLSRSARAFLLWCVRCRSVLTSTDNARASS